MSIDFILVMVSLFVWGIGEGMFFVFQPIYMAQLGASTITIASVISGFGVAMMVAHVPAGYLADRIGRKPLMIAAWAFGLVATWVMGLAHTLSVFVVGYLLYGLTAFVSSPLNSYITAARGKMTPSRAMTLMSAGFNVGAVIGPFAGGLIGDAIGLRTVYYISGGLFVISTVVLFFIKSQPRDHHDPASPPPTLLANTRFIGLLGVVFVFMFAAYLPQPLTARFLETERSLSLTRIGTLGSVNGMGNAFFNLLLGQFTSRVGLVLVQVCVAAFTVLIWRGTGMLWYAGGYFLLGGFRTSRSFVYSMARSLTHPAQMGLAYGVVETASSLAVALAPLLAGVLYTNNPELVFPVSLGLLGLACAVTLFFTPRPARSEVPVPDVEL